MLIQNSLIWWEKTVEYAFISWSKLQFDAVPLDGNMEKAGDTLFLNGKNELFLIEFKRKKDDECIQSELNKFNNYQDALIKIRNNKCNRCHFVVYGSIEYSIDFGLIFENYIDFIENKAAMPLGNSFNNQYDFFEDYTIDTTDFFEYLKFFCSLKKGKNLYGTSESPFANTLVATKNGAVVALDELIKTSPKLQQALNIPKLAIQPKEPTIERTISGPSW